MPAAPSAKQILFLDIDGVLNSDAFFERHPEVDTEHGLDPHAVARLNRICAEGDASVVVSSTWRLDMQLPELVARLERHGFRGQVIGVTEVIAGERGGEIDAWLDAHPGWRSFVILDDRADMGRLSRRLVRTTMARGLQDSHVQAALALLSKRVWMRW